MSCPDAAVLAAERGEGCLTSPVLSKPARGVSARRPRRPRRARVARRQPSSDCVSPSHQSISRAVELQRDGRQKKEICRRQMGRGA